ncbi:MAG: hypothetical protein ACR2PX_11780, partial [Endozoicomonas sp.]|uniref:hypothetical protein n=1 Tax=Endozoicomonas sp. TaxID=1892382 RepID=UPI003D9BD7E3
ALSFAVLGIKVSKDRQKKMTGISHRLEGCTGQKVAAKRPTLKQEVGHLKLRDKSQLKEVRNELNKIRDFLDRDIPLYNRHSLPPMDYFLHDDR